MKQKHMEEAIKLAEKSVKSGGGPFGAVVVKDGEVIGKGMNQVTKNSDPTCHAEVAAIREACRFLKSFQLDGCELYASAEPCPMCLGAIYWARPSVVYYANTRKDAAKIEFDDQFIYEEIGISPEDRQIPFIRLSIPEAKNPFKMWAQKSDKQEY